MLDRLPARMILAATTLIPLGAWAGDGCETPYEPTALASDLDAGAAQLEALDLDGASAALSEIHDRLPCLPGVAPRQDLARYGRSRATVAFFAQDEEAALRWARMAKYTWDGGPWPSIIPDGHPLTTLTEEMGDPLWGGPDDKQLAVGRGGSVFANGVFLARPRLPAEVPFLMQVFDRKGQPTDAHWQDGAAFGEALLEEGTGSLEPPGWYTPPADAPPPGLGEAETFMTPIVPADPDEPDDDPEPAEPDVPPEPVDDRPIEVRAREAWERAIGIADLNPTLGREKLTEFLEDFGDSGIPEVADAREWLERHPAEPAVPDVPDDAVPDNPPPRAPRDRTPLLRRGNPALRTAGLIAGGTALAMYGGAWGARAAYDGSPSDGMRTVTNGLTIGSALAGVGALGLVGTSLALGGE